jgi:hypothetical protein
MNTPLLKPRPKRNIFFAMRVSSEEKAEIEEVAHQLNIPMSHLVRYLVMNGVEQHKQALHEGGADDE